MKLVVFFLMFLSFGVNNIAFADQNSEIYDGIIAQAKDSSRPQLQGHAVLLFSAVQALSQMDNATIEPMTFSLQVIEGSSNKQFTGTSKVTYWNEPFCTKGLLTVNGSLTTSKRPIYFIKSVHTDVSSSGPCI